jgi:hypothetical protein
MNSINQFNLKKSEKKVNGKTTLNINNKSNNLTNPKKWIKNVKELTSRINRDYPKNASNNIKHIFGNFKQNGSINIDKIKKTIDEFKKKLATITFDFKNIKKYINTCKDLNYTKLDLNNIEKNSMENGIGKRLERLNISKNLLENFLDIINNSKKTYINSIKEDIENNYNTSLESYKEKLDDNTVKINALIDLTNNAANNNLIKRKKNITNIFESKNNTRENIIKNKKSYKNLKNELEEITELNNMNNTYNNLLNTIEPLGKNKKNNINLKIKTRSEKYKKEINEKTLIVEELIKTMQDHIDNLQEKINNSTVFSNESKEKMKAILNSLVKSKDEGSQDFKNEIKRLTDIMIILKKLIGEGNNNPNLHELNPNANHIRLPTSTTKKMKNLKENNIDKLFTYNTKNRKNIEATYLGRNDTNRIKLKTKNKNGKNRTNVLGKEATTMLNKNITFK